ncbi:MAG: imidazole glycerol phosphate synthase subunit HisF [Candidatus Ancillula sp.]|jgi:cyclase|nr:imidazole glycerol phosphate synthase subunit HisF [Candidatus Ancillula sp.]
MLAKRIIPCLDVKNGRVVKGVHFEGLVDAGDPVELAKLYYEQGADELTFLDVTASKENRGTLLQMVERVANQIFIPFTVGGGVRSVEDVEKLLKAGADKVSINSFAVARPELISQIAERFGKQVLVLSVDARRNGQFYEVTTHGGSKGTGIDALDWIKDAEVKGAGEILLNSMDADGTKEGFDSQMTKAVKEITNLPVIASGGAGKTDDFISILQKANPDAILAASVFHYREVTIPEVKESIKNAGFEVRV